MASRNGRYGSDSSASLHTPDITVQPRRVARSLSSCTSRDLPIPASPPRITAPPSPRRAESRSSSSREISASRPTTLGLTTRTRAIRSAPGLLGFLRLAQSPAERLQQPVADLGVLAQEGLEAPLGHRRRDQVGLGGDVRAAALHVEQRHLAEVVARTEPAVTAVARGHLRLALEDDEEADAVLAVDDHLGACLMADLAHLPRQLLEIAFREPCEQSDRLQIHRADSKRLWRVRTGASGTGGAASGPAARRMAAPAPSRARSRAGSGPPGPGPGLGSAR